MIEILSRLSVAGIVPVVVLDHVKDASSTAKAILAGGIDVMEITFRTAEAPDAIRAVTAEVPEMLVGAGTIVTLEQCKKAVECGAKFIVSPGFEGEVISWCAKNHIAVVPGCVTPTEIMAAMRFGLNVLKFFPANVYGGLSAMKALAGPFGGIKFIPTGGINEKNAGEFIAEPFIHAVGGSWICPKDEIAAGNFERITELCSEARNSILGFEVAHIGINCENGEESMDISNTLKKAFDMSIREGNSSNFVSDLIEVMKSNGYGRKGHIAIKTNSMATAISELEKRGFLIDGKTARYKGDVMAAVYLKDEIGGYAIHLLKK